jgi:hypothetical protein
VLNADTHGGFYPNEAFPWLFVGQGPGKRLDDIRAYDSRGGGVVAVSGDRLVLLRPGKQQVPVVLSRSIAATPAFGPKGKYLAYVKQWSSGKVVVRSLEASSERVIDLKGAIPLHIAFSRDGSWIVIEAVTGNQADRLLAKSESLTARLRPTSRARRACRANDRFHAYEPRPFPSWRDELAGDPDHTTIAVPTRTWQPATAPGLVGTLGHKLIVRASDGALTVRDEKGRSRSLVPGQCRARVVASFHDAGQVLVSCTSKRPHPLWLYGDRAARPLDRALWGSRPARMGELIVGRTREGKRYVLDPSTGRTTTLDVDDKVLHVHNRRALLRKQGRLVLLTERGQLRSIAGPANPQLVRARGPIAAVATRGQRTTSSRCRPMPRGPTVLVDSSRARSLGRIKGAVHMVTATGRALVTSRWGACPALSHGPLWWQDPE